ncbi:MAG: outer membrane beta-barrel protein [Balneolaceae bacterium]
MKVVLSLIAAILTSILLTDTLKAQYAEPDTRDHHKFGIKAGINVANVWGDQDREFLAGSIIGFAGGFFFGIPVGRYLGVQPELQVSQKGYERSGDFSETEYSFSNTATYIDVPLQLQIKPVPQLTLLAGPHYSFLVHQKDNYVFADEIPAEAREDLSDREMRDNLIGFTTGLDMHFQQIVISAKAGWDFSSNESDGPTEDPRYKNQWLQFTIGLKF